MLNEAYLKDLIAQITTQFEQTKSQLDGLAGAKQAFQMALDELHKPEEPKVDDEKPALALVPPQDEV